MSVQDLKMFVENDQMQFGFYKKAMASKITTQYNEEFMQIA